MSKIGQTHPYVTGDIDTLEIEECHRMMAQDPQYTEWADSYDQETINQMEADDGFNRN